MERIGTFGSSGHAAAELQLFQGLAPQDIGARLAACPVVHVDAGEAIGEVQGACLHIVLRGALEVVHGGTPDRSIDRIVDRVLPGECVGELAVLDEHAAAAEVRAVQDSELLVIDAQTLWQLVEESNGFARNLLRLLSFRIRAANAHLRRRQKVGEFYRQLSMADGLTGLQNRAWLNEHFPSIVEAAKRLHHPLSLMMIDIDHFKRFNDEHGHLRGDQALQVAARTIAGALRPSDFAVRYGGEELLVILPQTGSAAAAAVAQRLCEQLRQSVVFEGSHKPLPHLTASFGVAALAEGQTAEALLEAADAALYRAKQAGRDQVAV